jgi:hypothetical protein
MKLKKIICIYLMFVMVMTGCGQFRRLTSGSDITIKKQDENKNGNSGNNSGNKIVPADPTPSPTPSLLAIPTPPPSTGGKDDKDENENADKSSIGYLAIPLFAVVIAIGGYNQRIQQEAQEAQEAQRIMKDFKAKHNNYFR